MRNYRSSKQLEDWKSFKNTVRKTKRIFFNDKIQEIVLRNYKLWDLINWVRKQKLLATEAIQFNNRPYIKLDNLWQALELSFNSAYNHHININILDGVPSKLFHEWNPFLKEKFKNAICNCNILLASGLDKISWRILK